MNDQKNNYFQALATVIGSVIILFLYVQQTIGATTPLLDQMSTLVQQNGTTAPVASTPSSLSGEEKKKIEKKVDTLEELIDEKKDDLETLEQKAQNYQRMIDLKQQQQETLQNQLEMMDVQIQSFENSIAITKQEIDANNVEIDKLQQQIDETKKEIDQSKRELGEMLQLYDEIDQELSLELLSSQGDFSKALNRSEYLDQAAQKVREMLNQIEEIKVRLSDQQQIFTDKNAQLRDQKIKLEEKTFFLNNEKASKDVLLNETQGEEAKYRELLSRVEEQKQELIGDIDELSDDKRSELAKIKAQAPQPKSGTASTSWYYSQKDPEWGHNRIGLSSTLMKDYGCAVTAIAMVFTFHGETITPGKLAQQPIFYRDLIVWPEYWKGLSLTGGHAHGNIDWDEVDASLKSKDPVIVFVRARAGKGHYVVVHGKDKSGDYIVHDPLFGPNLYLETTKKLVGAIYNSSTTIDQMIIYKK